MTLLGKILTVLIFIMSIVFMSLSLMVFATHKNWKLVVSNTTPGQTQGLVQQLQAKTSEVENLNNQLGRLKDQYAAEQVARSYALRPSDEAHATRTAVAATRDRAHESSRRSHRTNGRLANAGNEQQSIARRSREIAGQRSRSENDRDSQFLKVVELTDQLNSAIGVERSLKEKREQLVEQVAQMKRVMDANGLTINIDTDAIPPKIDGVVLAIGGKDLLEISLGSDSGLKAGHEMEVYRGRHLLRVA
jgi:hypothetical protein